MSDDPTIEARARLFSLLDNDDEHFAKAGFDPARPVYWVEAPVRDIRLVLDALTRADRLEGELREAVRLMKPFVVFLEAARPPEGTSDDYHVQSPDLTGDLRFRHLRALAAFVSRHQRAAMDIADMLRSFKSPTPTPDPDHGASGGREG